MTSYENRFVEHQLAAQTTGSLVCLAGGDEARCSLLTGDKMPGRPISSARFASGWLLLRLSRGEIVQRRGDSHECRAAQGQPVSFRRSLRPSGAGEWRFSWRHARVVDV